MAEERPPWQVDRCPSWCAGGHAEGDHPDDRVHRSVGVPVPVTARWRYLGEERVEYLVDSIELEIGASRVDGERHTWFYLGAGPGQQIEISLACVSRLLAEAIVQLGLVEASDTIDDTHGATRRA